MVVREEVVIGGAHPPHVVVIDLDPVGEPAPVVEDDPGARAFRPVDVVAVVAAGLLPHLVDADGQVHRDRLTVPDQRAGLTEHR
jgi:hypothetical protein